LYCGFDPTAPSLHIGNLVPLLTLRRFQLAGHCPIALVGGATGLIGDPSERVDERGLNDVDVVRGWGERLSRQVSRFIDLDGKYAARVVDNLEWTSPLDALGFLRNIGKHFSVNAMIQRDSVKNRLGREGEGISYTEFSYMILQAYDFLHLRREMNCTVQIAGSDQYGNIVAGIDLIRRDMIDSQEDQFKGAGITNQLVTASDGSKIGKTEDGAIELVFLRIDHIPSNEINPSNNISILITSSNLNRAIHFSAKMQKVIRLQNHVTKFRVRNTLAFASQPVLDRIPLDHRVH
jgi:tyrosyl-tRNA synthetase